MIASHDVVDIVDTSRPHPNFSEVNGPGSSIGVLGLILGKVRSINMIMDVSELLLLYLYIVFAVPITFVPLLVVKLFVMVMSRVDGEILSHPSRQF